jgi:hypothetical protein
LGFVISDLVTLRIDVADNRLRTVRNLDPFNPNDLSTTVAKAAHCLDLAGERVEEPRTCRHYQSRVPVASVAPPALFKSARVTACV